MWDRLFILSMVVFFVGMVVVLTGEFVMPDWEPVTIVIGGSVAAFAGIVRRGVGYSTGLDHRLPA